MPHYLITYLGGDHPTDPQEARKHKGKYKQWLSSLGDAAVSPANPIRDTYTVHPDGRVSAGSATAMSGYTILEVESMDAALDAAKTCPFLEIGGSLEVSELIRMSG